MDATAVVFLAGVVCGLIGVRAYLDARAVEALVRRSLT